MSETRILVKIPKIIDAKDGAVHTHSPVETNSDKLSTSTIKFCKHGMYLHCYFFNYNIIILCFVGIGANNNIVQKE